MSNPAQRLMAFAEFTTSLRSRLSLLATVVSPLGLLACGANEQPITPIIYTCGSDPALAFENTRDSHTCGADDPNLPPEPTFPTSVCQTLSANKSTPDEADLDTLRVQEALTACAGVGPVKLVSDGPNNAFVTGHLRVDSVVLWVDAGVTLYASRNPDEFQGSTRNCGRIGINDSAACQDFISITGASPGIIGDGTIDGQGGEPLVGHDYSWWQMSGALRDVDGSIGNPTMINADKNTTKLLLYRITLHDSPKFHVKISSAPTRAVANPPCENHGDGFIVWGVTVLTPSKWTNSQGLLMTPQFSRNSDAVDPGSNSNSSCGVIACNTLTTGDDQIAIKGGHFVSHLVIAHNHFGTGHGMSIGSETMGDAVVEGEKLPAIDDIEVYDLTIDADSRWVGYRPSGADFNGIRIKSDTSRGGTVTNVRYHDICMRDITNSILISTGYNPLFSGKLIPNFGEISFRNVHGVTCMAQVPTVVSINGFNVDYPAGPVTLDNVVMDNIGPQATYASFANINLGPGDVNFPLEGLGVTVTNNIVPGSVPRKCEFPTLPVPEGKPEGWVW
jgi:polygalacturonase